MNNVDQNNQKSGSSLGVDFSYEFSNNNTIRLKTISGSSDFFNNEFVSLTGVQMRDDNRNSTNTDLQAHLIYERNIKISDKFSISPGAGVGLLWTQSSAFMWIYNSENGTTISVGDEHSTYGGIPLSLNIGYQVKAWNFELESGGMIVGEEGLIGIQFGPRISRMFGNKCD